MADIDQAIQEVHERLERDESALFARLTGIYQESLRRLADLTRNVQLEIDAARAAGEPVSESWLRRRQRYQDLIVQAERELIRAARAGGLLLTEAQRSAVREAMNDGTRLIALASGLSHSDEFTRIPTVAVEEILAATETGPLVDLLNDRAGLFSERAITALEQGIVLGQGTDVVARELTKAMGEPLWKAKRIARTETMRAYRRASLRTYQENDEVTGWVWHAALSSRTCGMCWAMHGTKHPLTEQMASHPACRCATVPLTRISKPTPLGTDLLAAEDDEVLTAVLGPGKAAAFKDGAFSLSDIVQRGHHAEWGPVRSERSLTALVGAEKAVEYVRVGSAT